MFLEYFDFIFRPFRTLYNKWMGAKNKVGNLQQEAERAKGYGQQAKGFGQKAAQFNNKLNAAAGQPAQGANMQQPGAPGAPGAAPGMPGAPAPGLPNSNPPLKEKGFWIFKKKFCSQCEQQLDKSWDACPYCAQIATQAAVAPAKVQAMKTQAFVMDAS